MIRYNFQRQKHLYSTSTDSKKFVKMWGCFSNTLLFYFALNAQPRLTQTVPHHDGVKRCDHIKVAQNIAQSRYWVQCNDFDCDAVCETLPLALLALVVVHQCGWTCSRSLWPQGGRAEEENQHKTFDFLHIFPRLWSLWLDDLKITEALYPTSRRSSSAPTLINSV